MSSIWNDIADCREYPALDREQRVAVAIVGGGIAGLTAARFLVEEGRSVAVVEAGRFGGGTTGGSTGKVTIQHGLVFADLIERAGVERARLYTRANQWALDAVAAYVEERNIACDLERHTAVVGARSPETKEKIAKERAALERLKIPVTDEPPGSGGPPLCAALGMENQIQFHPRKYVAGLAEEVAKGGAHLYENSRAVSVSYGTPVRIDTQDGRLVADHLLVTTNLPFLDRGAFFAKAFPRAHVAIAATVPEDSAPEEMVYCVDGEIRSYRSWRGNGKTYLIAISEGFVPGHLHDVEGLARSLETAVRAYWPIEEVTHRWTAEDYHSADRLPLVGKLTPMSRRIFTATGFGGWGLTNATAAARVMADGVVGRKNEWQEAYKPGRLRSYATKRFLRRNLHAGRHLVSGALARGERRPVSDLVPGDGGILDTEDGKIAVHRGTDGQVHALSPYCPHMGCLLSWNSLDRTWDCSCHGSRFSGTGTMIHGPASSDMKPKNLP